MKMWSLGKVCLGSSRCSAKLGPGSPPVPTLSPSCLDEILPQSPTDQAFGEQSLMELDIILNKTSGGLLWP